MRIKTITNLLAGSLALSAVGSVAQQTAFTSPDTDEWYRFPNEIKKVAVIGAGPSGLQSAAALIKEGFDVRLIERSDAPGGNWYHNTLTPVRESYPDGPLETAAYLPVPRYNGTKYYEDGDDGLTLLERWREHIRPSPIWDDLETNSSPAFTTLPEIDYPKDVTWALQAKNVQRHVRTYASTHGLNVNDRPINSSVSKIVHYSTRVERLRKAGSDWTLSLQRLTRLPESRKIKAEWWEESFDAVVVAAGGYHAAHVPDIKGLVEWSKVRQSDGHFPVEHSQHYRNSQLYRGKTVLIVGASVSASEISRRIGPHVEKLYISIRDTTRDTYMARRSIRRLYPEAEQIPEVVELGSLYSNTSLKDGQIKLINGSWFDGIDEIILATGFRRSLPFLQDFYSIGGKATPDKDNSPILTDAHDLHSLAWTGHYIPDPTLAFVNVRPWTFGRYQSLAFAKIWKGTARLPNKDRLWKQYFNDNHWQASAKVVFGTIEEETLGRQYVAWLNQESLIHGGRFVDQWPLEDRERFAYYSDEAWEHGYTSSDNFTRIENTPRDEWPTYPRAGDQSPDYEFDSGSEW